MSRGDRSHRVGPVFAVFGAIRRRAEHDHSIAESELSMQDSSVIGAKIDGLLFKAKSSDEPVDGGKGVAVADCRDDSGASGYGWGGHGVKMCHGAQGASWKNRRDLVSTSSREQVSRGGCGWPSGVAWWSSGWG